jgi:hypothetical protein
VFASSEEPVDRPRIESPGKDGKKYEFEYQKQLAEVRKMLSAQHTSLMATARSRTARYLLKVATTEPDINETSIFFLSLIPKQIRPQILHRWRLLIAARDKPGDPVFSPWHDLLTRRTPNSDKVPDSTRFLAEWKRSGVDRRLLDALTTSPPKRVREVTDLYARVLIAAAADDTLTDSDPLRKTLLGRQSPAWFPLRQTWYYMSRADKDKYRGLVRGLDILAVKSPHAAARAMTLRDSDELYSPVIFRRGDPTLPGLPVPRRFLQVLDGPKAKAFPNGSGRSDLARAITSPTNPLTARVLANRVWMHHFGEPLVQTPSDFGLQSERPTQLALLDFLADRLIRGGWKLKPLHRLIVSSQVWQRGSIVPSAKPFTTQLVSDSANRLLWRANRRRLDLESIRDTLLSVSGRLDLKMFGRPTSITSPNNRRRTVYAIVERQNIPDVVRNFDFASPDCSTARRQVTTVPQQALFMLNSEFVIRSAQSLASRSETKDSDMAKRIDRIYRLALRREATDDERALGRAFVTARGWDQFAQVLLMTNELMFVD